MPAMAAVSRMLSVVVVRLIFSMTYVIVGFQIAYPTAGALVFRCLNVVMVLSHG